jgi:hypothetical protein
LRYSSYEPEDRQPAGREKIECHQSQSGRSHIYCCSPGVITHYITMSTEQRDAATNQLEKQSTLKQGTRTALTTSNGAPVDTLTASMTAGER